ncbi:hypothetical protein BC830DRAFT_1172740 [Chytriomyces sp. MP71]|nr:hypothetical protein BC830DRAFT_1172740 [Chytriomyces sp. MP71]
MDATEPVKPSAATVHVGTHCTLGTVIWLATLVILNIATVCIISNRNRPHLQPLQVATTPVPSFLTCSYHKLDGFDVTDCLRTSRPFLWVTRKGRDECVAAAASVRASMDEDTDAWIKNTLGPDAFHLQFDGPARLVAAPSRFLPPCTYIFEVSVPLDGIYNLTLLHVATDFGAMVEVGQKADFVPRARVLVRSRDVFFVPPPRKVQLEEASKLRCDRLLGAEKGSFVKVWMGAKVSPEPFLMHRNDSCFDARVHSVLFAGDTRMKELYAWVARRLRGDPAYAPAESKSLHTFGSNLTMTWMQDDFLRGIMSDPIATLDAHDKLVFGFGHAPFLRAAEEGHWKMNQIKTHLKNVLEVLTSYAADRHARGLPLFQLVLTGPPAFPLCAPATEETPACSEIQSKVGWRSSDRLRTSTATWKALASERDVAFVDAFAATVPWILETSVEGTVVGSPGMQAVVDEVLHRINLCDVGL